ncbi:MAG TPA: Lrp/AsnC ligand binding domain-containing protein [Actinomycetota bacterium]|nr:Lrp/AsnC ligand binding domain-containing protein [Actinomycetota bacterium]
MVEAIVLIQVRPGPPGRAVSKEVAAIRGVVSAEDVSGPYDVIARAQARSLDELGKLVVAKIQGLYGVVRTMTCPVVHLE